MKSILRSTTAFAAIALAGSAFAADLPRRAAPPPVAFAPVPVFTWTGFYAGFNAGYGFGTNDNTQPTVIATNAASGLFAASAAAGAAPVGGVVAFSNRNSNEGFVGGGQIGYNYQFTPGSGFVIGVEADAQYADFGRSRNNASFFTVPAGGVVAPGAVLYNPNGLSGLDYFGTVRGRLGYAFDRTLVYATGGFAYGSGGGRQFGTGVSSDDFQTGYAVGGGVEYALPTDSFLNFFKSSAVTLKVEGLYVNLDRGASGSAFGTNAAGVTTSVPSANAILVSGPTGRQNTEFAVVRAGVNYKFGSY